MRPSIPIASCSRLTRRQLCRSSALLTRSTLRPNLASRSLATASSEVTPSDRPASQAPPKKRGGSKLFKDADDAVKDIKSGSIILSAGFGICGTAETIIAALRRREDLQDLTAVSNNAGMSERCQAVGRADIVQVPTLEEVCSLVSATEWRLDSCLTFVCSGH